MAELRKRLAFIIAGSSIYFIMSINIMRHERGCGAFLNALRCLLAASGWEKREKQKQL